MTIPAQPHIVDHRWSPAVASRQARLEQAMEQVVKALDADQPIDRPSLLAEYADVADELAACLDNLDFIQSVAPQLTQESLGAGDLNSVGRSPLTQPNPVSLGDFRIIREIGRGGMGVVYEAEQLSLGRRIALKVLPFAAMLDKQQLARFKNEARAAATLEHPNIVAVHSVGVDRGVHYYAMHLVEGESLAEVIARLRAERDAQNSSPAQSRAEGGPNDCDVHDHLAADATVTHHPAHLNPQSGIPTVPVAVLSTLPESGSREWFRAVAKLGIQAAEALDHAHQNGVLHRDVKPGNLLVDDSGKLWVTDFGLARLEADAGMTMTGDLIGTLRYMSPEQAMAKRVLVDQRSDVYSLGVTLYELLTLQPAYSAEDRQELLRQIAFEEPRQPRQVDATIPRDLETIVLKSIEKNPMDRFATAQEFADDLKRFIDNRSIRARRPTIVQRAQRLLAAHRIAAALVGTAAVILLMAATAYLADRRRQIDESNLFVENSFHAAQIALEAGRVEEANLRAAEAIARVNAVPLVKSDLAHKAKSLLDAIDRYQEFTTRYKEARNVRGGGNEKALTAAEEAISLYHANEGTTWLTELKRSSLASAQAKQVPERVYELMLLLADDLTRWSEHWPQATRQAQLEAQSRDALAWLDKAIAFHAPTRGYYWLRANCSWYLGDRDAAQRLRATAMETPPHDAAELFYINRDRLWGAASQVHGYPVYSFEENYKAHREMLRLDPSYYNALFFMGYRLQAEKRYAEALVAWYGCVAARPNDLAAVVNRGTTHSRLKQFDEAKADYETCLAALPDNPSLMSELAYEFATSPDEEMRDGKRAVALAEKACELTHFDEIESLLSLAAAYAETGDFDAATKWAEKAVSRCDNYKLPSYQEHLECFRQRKPWREPNPLLEQVGRGQ